MTRLQDEMKDRAETRADRASDRASDAWSAQRAASDRLPPGGEPIKVGHHSEGRHRRDIDRSWKAMGKAVEMSDRAESLRAAAANAGNSILTRDPEAIDALEEQLGDLEANRAAIKLINKAFRRGGWPEVEKLDADTEPERRRLDQLEAQGRRNQECWGPVYSAPFPPYELQNRGANIRRIRARLEGLRARADLEDRVIEFEGGRVEEDVEGDRIRLFFDEHLPRDVWTEIRRNMGFRWSRSLGCFSRHLNGNGRWAVKRAVKHAIDLEIEL